MLMFNAFLRAVVMVTKRQKFTQLLDYMKVIYTELMMRDDIEIRRIMQEHTELALKVSKINLFVGILAGVGFSVFPIMSDKREFIFGIYLPYLDEYRSPWYEILLTIQCVLNLYGLCMFIPFTGIFVSFIIFAIAISKILQYKLNTISQEVSSKLVQRKIIKCIELHWKLIRFVNNINERNFTISLVDLILFVVVLCIMLLSFILVTTVLQKCVIIVYIITVFSQPFILYYFSNEVYYESLEISTAAYNVNWFNYDIETQKMLKIFLLRTQKPCAVLIMKTYVINLGTLQSLLKFTYSIFTLLQQFYG
ncbi:odorant receptor 30a-like [Musca vetustissima]|uniref:odorant receptor 30a-like n=1 Tax=Musca vetustissima TaxID=27455 RepID=UPI002AB69D6E|nr:odorant receptor 30a-like [Musca vetustissima]